MNKKGKKRLLNKKNKTLKKRDNSCDKFCKNVYSPELEKQFQKMATIKLPPPTKEQLKVIYNIYLKKLKYFITYYL